MDAMAYSLSRASTGIPGLDEILGGGLARNRLHLLEGTPGTVRLPPPRLGEHTRAVLAELGFTTEEIATLMD